MKKQLLIGVAASSLGIVSLVGIASAATNTKPAMLAQEIAAKFNLKQSDVQTVIDTHKSEERSYRDEKQADRIANAVKAGTITQTKADTLTAKLLELKANRPTEGSEPTAAQRTAMEAKMDEFRTWLEDNNIPASLVRPFGHGGRGMHEGAMGADHN